MGFERLDSYIKHQIDKHNVPGMAVALTDRNQVIWSGEFGCADIKTKKAVTKQDLFGIGSITKSFTAVALLKEWEKGNLDLHAPITNYLPLLRVGNSFTAITAHHLLNNTAGLPLGRDDIPSSEYMAYSLHQYRLRFAPGSNYVNSNFGYQILGYLLEKLTSMAYNEVISQTIFTGLRMSLSQAKITSDTRVRMAEGYNYLHDDRPRHASSPLSEAPFVEYCSGDGAIASTAVELSYFLRMLLNNGEGMLSAKSFEMMTSCMIERWANSYYGYGLFIRTIDGHNVIGHGGDMIGYQSMMLGDVEDGLGAVVLINGPGYPYYTALYALRLLREQLRGGKTAEEPELPNQSPIKNLTDYLGRYENESLSFYVKQRGSGLIMEYDNNEVLMESRGNGFFFAAHPDFATYLLKFERNQSGNVVKSFYGGVKFTNERYKPESMPKYPPEWNSYEGHYRAHNPWHTNFRIVIREGKLLLIEPGNISYDSYEVELRHVNDGLFWVGCEETDTEWIHFDTVVDGRALRLCFTGCEYYRCSTK